MHVIFLPIDLNKIKTDLSLIDSNSQFNDIYP